MTEHRCTSSTIASSGASRHSMAPSSRSRAPEGSWAPRPMPSPSTRATTRQAFTTNLYLARPPWGATIEPLSTRVDTEYLGLTDDQSTLIFLVGDPKTGRTLYATAIADGGARSVAEGASAVLSAGGSRIVFYTNGNDVAWVDL